MRKNNKDGGMPAMRIYDIATKFKEKPLKTQGF
jgi:hypothetical protein